MYPGAGRVAVSAGIRCTAASLSIAKNAQRIGLVLHRPGFVKARQNYSSLNIQRTICRMGQVCRNDKKRRILCILFSLIIQKPRKSDGRSIADVATQDFFDARYTPLFFLRV
jgi:hypothetical protein